MYLAFVEQTRVQAHRLCPPDSMTFRLSSVPLPRALEASPSSRRARGGARADSDERMGCVSSKGVEDASVARSNPAPAGDHRSSVVDEAREKSSASFTAPSSAWGESRPVPQARRFPDDGPGTSSGPPPASRRSAPSVSADGPGDAPLEADDELRARMRPRPGACAGPAEDEAAADAAAARREKKAKNKRDKNRVTDLEAHDLEGEDPETKTEMLRRRAAASRSAAMQRVFGDVEDFSDGNFSPEGSPRKGEGGVAPLGGPLGGSLITGAAVRHAARGTRHALAPIGGVSRPPEPPAGESATALDAFPASGASFAPEPLHSSTEDGPRVPEEQTSVAPPPAPPEPARLDDFVWQDDEREEDAAPPEAPLLEPAAPAGDLGEHGREGGDPETTTMTPAELDPQLTGASEDAYAEEFEPDEVDVAAAPAPASDPPPAAEREQEPAPESEALLNKMFDAGDLYAADLGIPSASAGDADAGVEISPFEPLTVDDDWADGGFDDRLEAAGEADVDYDDAGLAEEDDDVF